MTSPEHVHEVQQLAAGYPDEPKTLAVAVLTRLQTWHRNTYSSPSADARGSG
jgi:hypothetical protein